MTARARLPWLYFAVLSVLLAASVYLLADWQRSQHACSCVLGGDYAATGVPEDCLVHGRDAE